MPPMDARRKHSNDERCEAHTDQRSMKRRKKMAFNRNRDDDHQMMQRSLHIMELASPLDVVAGRKFYLAIYLLLPTLLHISAQVAVLDIDTYHDAALTHAAVDRCRVLPQPSRSRRSFSGTRGPAGELICRPRISSTLSRKLAGSRTTLAGNDAHLHIPRSQICPRLPISITSFTSAAFKPYRAIAPRSILMVKYCCPPTRSTRVS